MQADLEMLTRNLAVTENFPDADPENFNAQVQLKGMKELSESFKMFIIHICGDNHKYESINRLIDSDGRSIFNYNLIIILMISIDLN